MLSIASCWIMLVIVSPNTATEHVINQNLGLWIQNRLENLDTGQALLRVKIPVWDEHFRGINLKLDALDQRLTHIELGASQNRQKHASWKETDAEKPPSEELATKIVAQLMYQKRQPELNILGLGLETLTESVQGLQVSLDDLLEKFLRLADQNGQGVRQILQGMNRVHEVVTAGLELSAALKTESVAESRRLARVFDAKATQLQFRLEKALQPSLMAGNVDNQSQNIDKLLSQMEQIATKCVPGSEKAEKVENPSLEFVNPKNKRSHAVRTTWLPNRSSNNIETTTAMPSGTTRKTSSSFQTFTQTQGAYRANSVVVHVGGKSTSGGATKRFSHDNQATAPFGKPKTIYDLKPDFDEDEDETYSNALENMTAAIEKTEERILQHMSQQVSLLTNKLSNMYEELWKSERSTATEMQILAAVVNSTKWDMDDGFRTLVNANDPGRSLSDSSGTISRRLSAMETRLGGQLDVLQMVQTSLLESCDRIQENEPQFKTMIYEVLDKMLQLMANTTCEGRVWEISSGQLLPNNTERQLDEIGDSETIKSVNNSIDLEETLGKIMQLEEIVPETTEEERFNVGNSTDYAYNEAEDGSSLTGKETELEEDLDDREKKLEDT